MKKCKRKNLFNIRRLVTINEVVNFLQENPVQYLATVGRDGKAKCRPFMFCFEQDGKLWFCTNNTKDVYKDIQNNPYIEVCVSSPSYEWIRLNGKVVFREQHGGKRRLYEQPDCKGTVSNRRQPDF